MEHEKIIVKPGVGHIDHWYSHEVVLPTLSLWKSVGFSANGLTTLGAISSGGFVYFYQGGSTFLALVFLAARWYFDYADGMFARHYNDQSEFGDYYDHAVDMMFFIGTVWATWKVFAHNKCARTAAMVVLMLFAVLATAQMSCIELECGEKCSNNGSLSPIKLLSGLCANGSDSLKYVDNSFLYLVIGGLVATGHCMMPNAETKDIFPDAK